MARKGRSRWYSAAKLFALAFVVLLGLIFFVAMKANAPRGCENCVAAPPNDSALLLGLGALCFTGLGTISTVILGWRSERRQSAESRLRIAQLELQLAQARADAERSG